MRCNYCRIGRYQPTTVPYYSRFAQRIMVIPHVPAQKCDVCGHVSHDADFILRMQYMLDELTAVAADPATITPPAAPNQNDDWYTSRRSS
ncbi:MAG TPA: YgiT-type zinc finger protein [Anaerolineae bacterium]|nr:YgiT-type zinc finger protein [Anaerolineae bacterium]HIP73311.1 YgiT-type zinc finger protein [Anaerolineae bacterium]